MQPNNLNIKIEDTSEVLCSKCGHNIFVPGFMFRQASRFLTGGTEDTLIPIQVFICELNGHVMEDTLPIELKNQHKK